MVTTAMALPFDAIRTESVYRTHVWRPSRTAFSVDGASEVESAPSTKGDDAESPRTAVVAPVRLAGLLVREVDRRPDAHAAETSGDIISEHGQHEHDDRIYQSTRLGPCGWPGLPPACPGTGAATGRARG